MAVNAEKATSFLSSRELPVLWAITKGAFINKLIIIPIALLLNGFFPVAIKEALVLGGLYLAFEGVEKTEEFVFHRGHASLEIAGGAAEHIEHYPDAEKQKINRL